MNFVSLCSSVLLFLSLVTCSEADELEEWRLLYIAQTEEIELAMNNLPVMEPLIKNTREFVDDPAMNSEYTRFLVWYMIPEEVRKEIIHNYYYYSDKDVLILCKPLPGMVCISPHRYYEISPEELVEKVENDRDWINLSNTYLLNTKIYSEKSQFNFLIEAIKNASPSSIEEIFQRRPHALVLLKKIQTKASEELVNFILDSRTIASDIIEIFRIFERYSDLDMANLKYLQKIRSVAYERDDCELLMFTNAYPDLISPTGACQMSIFDYISLNEDKIPRFWSLICDDVHKSARSLMFNRDKFVKFRLFSEPVNYKAWTLDMYAVACQEYEIALKLPLCITLKSSYLCNEITTGIQDISQMIPIIPDPVYRQRFIEKYNLRTMDPSTFKTKFNHLNQSGKKSTVEVIPYCEQQNVECVAPPVRIADTKALVSKIISNN